jgi:hypothetical protein
MTDRHRRRNDSRCRASFASSLTRGLPGLRTSMYLVLPQFAHGAQVATQVRCTCSRSLNPLHRGILAILLRSSPRSTPTSSSPARFMYPYAPSRFTAPLRVNLAGLAVSHVDARAAPHPRAPWPTASTTSIGRAASETNAFGLAAQGSRLGRRAQPPLLDGPGHLDSRCNGFDPPLRLRRPRRGLPAARPSSAPSCSSPAASATRTTWLRFVAARQGPGRQPRRRVGPAEVRSPRASPCCSPTGARSGTPSRGPRSTGCFDAGLPVGVSHVVLRLPWSRPSTCSSPTAWRTSSPPSRSRPGGLGIIEGVLILHPGRIWRAPRPGHPRRAGLPPRQLLDTHPRRRRGLRAACSGGAGPEATSGRYQARPGSAPAA